MLYVDGSKTNKGSGAGIYCKELNLKLTVPLDNMTTVILTELVALINGVKEITQKKL